MTRPTLRPLPWAQDGAPTFISRPGRLYFQYAAGGEDACAGCGEAIRGMALETLPLSFGDRPGRHGSCWHQGCVDFDPLPSHWPWLSAAIRDRWDGLLAMIWREDGPTDDLVTVKEAAEILGVSYPEADRLVRVGHLAVVERVGSVRRLRRRDVVRRAAEHVRRASQPPPSGA